MICICLDNDSKYIGGGRTLVDGQSYPLSLHQPDLSVTGRRSSRGEYTLG